MPAARFQPSRPAKRLAALIAALIVLVLVGPGMPAVAAPAPAPITVGVVPADSGDLAGGAVLKLFVTLANGGVDATTAATVTVSVAGSPVTARSTLANWFSGAGSASLAARTAGTAVFPAVASGLSSGVEVSIPSSSLPFTSAGVYPIAVSIASGPTTLGEARSAVAWNVAATNAVPVAIAVPLTVPAGESTFLTAAQLAVFTGPGGILTRQLGDVSNSEIAVGIDPRILASINILGKSAPQSALDWLGRLRALPNETFPLAWADADITSPLHAGEASVLETKSLDYAIDPSQFPVNQSPSSATPTPTPTSDTTEPVVPTSATLVAWNYTMPQLSWPAENSVAASDLAKLNEAGITSAIVSSTNATSGDARDLTGASAKIGTTALAISDSVLSGYLRTAIQSPTTAVASEALTELTTSLALVSIASGATTRPVLLTLARNWANTDTNFEQSVNEISLHSWSAPTTLGTILATPPTTATISAPADSTPRVRLITSMLAAEQSIVGFAPIAESPDTLTSSTRLKLLSLLSNEWTTASWMTAGNAFLTQAGKIVGSVQVDHSKEILAIADQTSLPVSVSNGLDQDVTVTLTVASLSTRVILDQKSSTQVITVEAGAQRRVLIPMSALSNGKAAIVVTLKSSTGVQIGQTRTVNINVQAGWETAGTLIFAALIVGLFGFGIIRTIRKRRRAASAPDAT